MIRRFRLRPTAGQQHKVRGFLYTAMAFSPQLSHGACAKAVALNWSLFNKKFMETTARKIMGNKEHREGGTARAIEEQTAKLPSDTFLWAAGAAMLASLTLKVIGKSHTALFIGQWAAPLLLFGIYDKIVKVAGHDKEND